MGRGDKKSRRGKIFAGSFGKTRLRKKKKGAPVEATAKTKKEKKTKAAE